ncbi:MAG TPA: hypothetical protein P5186_06160 [Candidatus Paceibacterota bacterium]|nr:hypothetical protein [Candidatus Paceibacterota bacterium]
MNTFATGSLFDNPLVVLTILMAGALASWLMKRRQETEAARHSQDDESPKAEAQRPSQRELDLQEVLRQLLGGEPPPRAPQPPPISPVMRDAQPAEAWSDEEQFQPKQAWMDEPQETYESARPPAIQTAPPSRPGPTLEAVRPVRPVVQADRRSEPLKARAKHPAPPATVVDTGRERRSREGTRAIGLLRDHRTVRQAFVASLVFGPPKAFES